ncbi:efflux RND transporter periplasmic adaptor subunit [Algihabitans albus]|uniref:efflux RND transporter periplasmic adaptor subunit n=1 Tax=Algihabitans albus TaxID=2164067 RepID=UPI000E5D4913|nr:HlyD family efflux transporter periplasmic adaptor subunit [Algihabitans albus]
MSARARRIALWAGLAALLLAGLVYAFRPKPVPVDLAEAERGALVVTVDEEGETRVRDVFVLSAPIAGLAQRIDADVGDLVIANQTVITGIEPIDPDFLDPRSEAEARAALQAAEAGQVLAAAELAQAEAELNYARAEVERARGLQPGRTISQSALDNAERAFLSGSAAAETAKAALRIRQFELDQARARLLTPLETQAQRASCECVPITAPVSGNILRIVRESEGVVRAGDPLVEIGDPRDLEIVSDLLSVEAVKVEEGQTVLIEEWGGAILNGRVRRVEPYGFTKVSALGIEEQRVNVIVDFTDPPEHWPRLGHGYRVEVRIVLWRGDEVLKLPMSALFRNGDDWSVFVDHDGRARTRSVEIGQHSGLEAEIITGLAEGERVVLHPSDRVAEGVRITPRS